MTWRKKFMVLLALGLVVVSAMFRFTREREPSYEGKTLSQWLKSRRQTFCDTNGSFYDEPLDPAKAADAERAVRGIGTNAIPLLLTWIRYEPPTWPRTLADTLENVGSSWSRAERLRRWNPNPDALQRQEMAVTAFQILGPATSSAVPELSNIMTWARSVDTYECAIDALGGIGKDAARTLALAIVNPRSDF